MKSLLVLPADHQLLLSLEASVTARLTAETDRDAMASLRTAIEELDKIELTLKVGIAATWLLQ